MEMPTLEDIFYEMNFGKATSNMLEDEENSLRGYLEKLVEKKGNRQLCRGAHN